MPIKVPNDLPAIEFLGKENIFVMDEARATTQDIRPMKMLILNLMPIKEDAENDLIRALSNTPLQVEVEFLKIAGRSSTHTSESHMNRFYKTFDEIKNNKYDGMIVTGAPIEKLNFEEVSYWSEIEEIFDWIKKNVTSCVFSCWASQAALYHYYGVNKYIADNKIFGVFKHTPIDKSLQIFRGFDDVFYAPHSRHSQIDVKAVEKNENIEILSKSEEGYVYLVKSKDDRFFFVSGHPEYDKMTLDTEYRRDLKLGLDILPPKNYYRDNNPELPPEIKWRAHGNLFFSNWLNYYVYQATPYNLDDISY